MKKLLIAIALVLSGVTMWLGWQYYQRSQQAPQYRNESIAATSLFVKACDVLTQNVATEALGEGVTKVDTTTGDVVTGEAAVTSCVYQAVSSERRVSLTVHASSPDRAKQGFSSGRQADAREIVDIGELAYWSPTYAQVNVLKGQYWLLVSVGETQPGERAATDSADLARRLVKDF